MTVTVSNLIQGPGTLYSGTFGATEPADSTVNTAPPASSWTDAGGTQDGVKLTFSLEYSALEVDQLVDTPERRLTARDLMLETNLAEATLENLALAMNTSAPTTGAGFKYHEPADASSATQPTYKALIFDGYSPSSFRRRVVGRKMLATDGVGTEYKKDGQTLFPVKFAAHYVSSSIKPYRVIDQTS